MIIAAQIISAYPPAQRQFLAYPCSVLHFIIRSDTALLARYPACAPLVDGTNTLGDALQVAVEANFNMGPEGNETEQLAAALHACFGMAGWLATALHVVGTEVYLKLTPKEGERLRRISYERQVSCFCLLLLLEFVHGGLPGIPLDTARLHEWRDYGLGDKNKY